MLVYLRHFHKISQNPEQDTEGPYRVNWDQDPKVIWKQIQKHAAGRLSRRNGGEPRFEKDGVVFFLSGTFHSLLVMPAGGEYHRKHAPPSHFAKGGVLKNKPKVTS